MKKCSKCKIEKDLETQFSILNHAKGYRASQCRSCVRASSRNWMKKNMINLDYAGRMNVSPTIKRG